MYIKLSLNYLCYPALSGTLTLLHSEQPKLHRVFAVLSAMGLNTHIVNAQFCSNLKNYLPEGE